MFNLNIPPSSLLGIDGTGLCTTPKTPEIVNSLIAMTNPMDNYCFSTVASTPGSIMRNFNGGTNAQLISQDSSHSSCSASPLNSPAGSNTTPSVQQTCSQLIKAGLKLSIQSKRKLSTCDSSSGSEQPNSKCARRGITDEDCDDTTDDDSEEHKSTMKGLTPEDEDRRRRRRERNKIAATKCRMKKRERTQNLIKESEILDTQNVELKTQVRTLERERRKLLDMLNGHAPTCLRRGGFNLPSKLQQSPAYKYLADLDIDGNAPIGTPTNGMVQVQVINSTQRSPQQTQPAPAPQQRTVIPPMSTIKFSRSNGFKAAAAHQMQQQHQQHQQQQHHQHSQQLPNGYCKASPTPQELGYLSSPSQDNIVCLATLQSALGNTSQAPTQQHEINTTSPVAIAVTDHQLSDYIPNCDESLNAIGLSLAAVAAAHTPSNTPTSNESSNIVGGLQGIGTPTGTNEFVKNELVDSQSPYTTAQSAERFLFEADHFVDIKHGVSLNNNNTSLLNHNNIIDFHSSLTGSLVPFPDQISIKNDYLHEADFLAQLAAEGGEFVDLDTGVAAAFLTNGGCLA